MKYVLVTTPTCSRCAIIKEQLKQMGLSGMIIEGSFKEYRPYVMTTPHRSAPVFLAIDTDNDCVEFSATELDCIVGYMAPLMK